MKNTTTKPSTIPARRRRGRRLLVIGVLLLALLGSWFGYRGITGRPAGSPQAVELADAGLSDELTSATVLAVGEATHGTSEFRVVWRQVAQKVADRGFTSIVLEENTGSVSRVNEWVQGGPGTVEQAVGNFGFRLSRTREMADFLGWAREYNRGKPAAQRIQFYGLDMQRPVADRDLALGWLSSRDKQAAATVGAPLADVTDDTAYDSGAGRFQAAATALQQQVDRLAAEATDDAALRARASARSLVEATRRGAQGAKSYDRDAALAEQLAWLVEQRARTGAKHTLLLAHNGHVDKSGQASMAPGAKLGVLAAQRWGSSYRVIGVDARRVWLTDQGKTHGFTVNSPVRGIFAGTSVGYLELAQASPENRVVLDRSLPMASAGSPFSTLQRWLPFFHEVRVAPSQAFDALIYVNDSHPTHPLDR